MIIEDIGIILSVKSFQEHHFILRCFLSKHGLMNGMIAASKENKKLCIVGNIVSVVWKARLREQLGYYKIDMIKNTLSSIIFNRRALALINSAIILTNVTMQEKDPQPLLFTSLFNLFLHIEDAESSDDLICNKVLARYLEFELQLLSANGFGLNLSRCAVTNTDKNLAYISPRTGSAVTEEIGHPYAQKIMKMPAKLLNYQSGINVSQLLECLQITGFFIEKNIFFEVGNKIPFERTYFLELLH